MFGILLRWWLYGRPIIPVIVIRTLALFYFRAFWNSPHRTLPSNLAWFYFYCFNRGRTRTFFFQIMSLITYLSFSLLLDVLSLVGWFNRGRIRTFFFQIMSLITYLSFSLFFLFLVSCLPFPYSLPHTVSFYLFGGLPFLTFFPLTVSYYLFGGLPFLTFFPLTVSYYLFGWFTLPDFFSPHCLVLYIWLVYPVTFFPDFFSPHCLVLSIWLVYPSWLFSPHCLVLSIWFLTFYFPHCLVLSI